MHFNQLNWLCGFIWHFGSQINTRVYVVIGSCSSQNNNQHNFDCSDFSREFNTKSMLKSKPKFIFEAKQNYDYMLWNLISNAIFYTSFVNIETSSTCAANRKWKQMHTIIIIIMRYCIRWYPVHISQVN